MTRRLALSLRPVDIISHMLHLTMNLKSVAGIVDLMNASNVEGLLLR